MDGYVKADTAERERQWAEARDRGLDPVVEAKAREHERLHGTPVDLRALGHFGLEYLDVIDPAKRDPMRKHEFGQKLRQLEPLESFEERNREYFESLSRLLEETGGPLSDDYRTF